MVVDPGVEAGEEQAVAGEGVAVAPGNPGDKAVAGEPGQVVLAWFMLQGRFSRPVIRPRRVLFVMPGTVNSMAAMASANPAGSLQPGRVPVEVQPVDAGDIQRDMPRYHLRGAHRRRRDSTASHPDHPR